MASCDLLKLACADRSGDSDAMPMVFKADGQVGRKPVEAVFVGTPDFFLA